jgi:hypothetical protein
MLQLPSIHSRVSLQNLMCSTMVGQWRWNGTHVAAPCLVAMQACQNENRNDTHHPSTLLPCISFHHATLNMTSILQLQPRPA